MVAQRPHLNRQRVEETAEFPATLAPEGESRLRDASVPEGTLGSTVLPEVSNQGNEWTFKPRAEVRYRTDTLLGRGGMGEVQLARDQDIGRQIAVKRLLDQKDPRALARFIDEVRTVGNLEHPNIVPIHDVGVDPDGSLFFVMKYVEGETLASIIKKLASGDEAYHRRYSFEARLDLFAGLLRALQYTHEQGLVHRDVKPENIMVGEFGEVVLMDWGIAHRMREQETLGNTGAVERARDETLDGMIIGTPRYMSPEQAAGNTSELDGRSDLYSAFVVLYELLTTESYIDPGTGTMEAVRAARERQPPRGTEAVFNKPHQASVPSELRHFLRTGLAHAKEDRFENAEEVLRRLVRIRSGDCDVNCPLTLVKAANTRMERFMDRHPLIGLLLILAALASCGSGLFVWGRSLVATLM